MPKPITCRIGSSSSLYCCHFSHNFPHSSRLFLPQYPILHPNGHSQKQNTPDIHPRYYLFLSRNRLIANHLIITLLHDFHQRQKYNLKILFQTSIIYILHVISYLIRHDLLHVSPVRITCLSQNGIFIHILDRSIIRYTRSNNQHFTLLNSIHIHILSHLRPRSHQTHLPSYHVQQLR